jgi:predicted RNA-binding Zn-ribbon protein involved in translation (DUF1610 family)
MYTKCWKLTEHRSSSSQVILTSFHFHYTYSWHYLCNQTQKVAHINSKLRLQNQLGVKFPCPKCGKKLRSRTLKLREIRHYLHGVFVQTIGSLPKFRKILNWEMLDQDLTAAVSTCTSVLMKAKTNFLKAPFSPFLI